MGNGALLWLALLVIFIVAESVTVGLVSIWFAAGAMAAMFAAAAGAGVIWQWGIFIAASAALLIFTRPLVKKYVNARHEKTNYEKKIGETVKVTERVDNKAQTGRALADGIEWTARALNGDETFDKGAYAKVAEIRGVKLILTKCEEDM